MSLSNLLVPNNYDIYANTIKANNVLYPIDTISLNSISNQIVLGKSPNTTTLNASPPNGNITINLPLISDTITSNNAIQILNNKSFIDNTTSIINNNDNSKKIIFNINGSANTIMTLTSNPTANRTLTFPDVTDTLVSLNAPQIITSKLLIDNSSIIGNSSDNTKTIRFSCIGNTNTSTTITSSQTANRVITLPDSTDTLVGLNTAQTISNKIFGTAPTFAGTTNQLILQPSGTGTSITLTAPHPISNRIYTIPDQLIDASFIMNAGNNTMAINGPLGGINYTGTLGVAGTTTATLNTRLGFVSYTAVSSILAQTFGGVTLNNSLITSSSIILACIIKQTTASNTCLSLRSCDVVAGSVNFTLWNSATMLPTGTSQITISFQILQV